MHSEKRLINRMCYYAVESFAKSEYDAAFGADDGSAAAAVT